LAQLLAVGRQFCCEAQFRITKNFCDGFVLTLRWGRRSIMEPRETIAIAAVTFKAPNARKSSAIDPVETGFPGAGMSRETQFFITACETANRRVPAMEVTPPEYQPGSA